LEGGNGNAPPAIFADTTKSVRTERRLAASAEPTRQNPQAKHRVKSRPRLESWLTIQLTPSLEHYRLYPLPANRSAAAVACDHSRVNPRFQSDQFLLAKSGCAAAAR
jgi:hypothetical protein